MSHSHHHKTPPNLHTCQTPHEFRTIAAKILVYSPEKMGDVRRAAGRFRGKGAYTKLMGDLDRVAASTQPRGTPALEREIQKALGVENTALLPVAKEAPATASA